jgi:hypothetical protein
MLSAEPPTGAGLIHEVKHDGFRTLLRIDGIGSRTKGAPAEQSYASPLERCDAQDM